MNRIILIQEIINKGKYSTYLEIGSQSGKSFLPIKCKNKIAVDPVFNIPLEKRIKWLFKNPLNIRNKYFEETSDDFFLKRKSILKKTNGIDVVLIDGLHTFKTSLTDVFNSLEYLNMEGEIILHDCYPPNNAAATPAMSKNEAAKLGIEGWTGEWCGDVWKTIVYLRRSLSDCLEAYVIDTDYGLGVVRVKKKINKPLSIDLKLFNEIDKIEYEYLVQNVYTMLDLKDKGFVMNLINRASYQI
jgi:hypothetical protein